MVSRNNGRMTSFSSSYRSTERAGFADDSGLVVDELGGQPGVRSARFAGEGASDAENNAKLLSELVEVPEERVQNALESLRERAIVRRFGIGVTQRDRQRAEFLERRFDALLLVGVDAEREFEPAHQFESVSREP